MSEDRPWFRLSPIGPLSSHGEQRNFGKSPFCLDRGRLGPAERGLLHHIERLKAAYPDRRVFTTLDLWSLFSQHADDPPRGNKHDLRNSFDQALAGLAERGLVDWRDGVVEVIE